MITIATPSGTVRAVSAEADATGAVRYHLTGAATGTVHVTATSSPARWDQFDAVRATLGSASAREWPAEPLVRIRGRAYWGTTVRVLARSADVPWGWLAGDLKDTADRPAPLQASQTLTAILRACASHYAARSDFPSLQHTARRHDTPQLLTWLDAMITHSERAQARWLQEAETYRVQATRTLAAWWTLARWFTAYPHPVLALLLASGRESLAHRAEYLPKWAEISTRAAEDEGRRLALFRSEREGLARPAAAPDSSDRPYFVVGQWKGGGDVDIWHVEEAPSDPGERADLCEQYTVDADDAFSSVEIVYAASPQAAAEQARREARETSERIHRDLTRP
ncbi:hypothetical protein SAMN06272735_9155 [Streptomyces sp. TLI_55]|uniref:hypothetical protein n=1 Tax=Streptomyces sp. TLI_55 TaxID=1938861 RepID=UPI000BCDF1C9|nr:hypothetical protein [Streptomyces sp. TLI_55]SNX88665.1 hypothetical protein SAMN06272735_9155 [Streptomyces sp. TLI_55]